MHYAKGAQEAGLDGVVCSPLEAGKVHNVCGDRFLTVTPGVRFAQEDAGDQKRITTPEKAKKLGSDYIVVGRPVTRADDPVGAMGSGVRQLGAAMERAGLPVQTVLLPGARHDIFHEEAGGAAAQVRSRILRFCETILAESEKPRNQSPAEK